MNRLQILFLCFLCIPFLLGIQGCSDVNENEELTMIDLTLYAWEWNGDSEYWIDSNVGAAERDVESFIYFFLDTSHGIKCNKSYNFDYVAGSHSISRKGYPFTYELYNQELFLYFEGGREEFKITSGGNSITDSHGLIATRRNYNSDDEKFIDEWLPFCWPELCANESSNNGGQEDTSPYAFDLKAPTIQVIRNGKYSREWVVWLSFGTNNLYKHKVTHFELDIKALNGKITNKKEYGTVNVYPDYKGVTLLVTGLQNVKDDNHLWWSTILYVSTGDEEELELEFSPSWSNSAGTFEGEVVRKTYAPTSIIESE